jgi:uncharacterized delta-60 repeat protein
MPRPWKARPRSLAVVPVLAALMGCITDPLHDESDGIGADEARLDRGLLDPSFGVSGTVPTLGNVEGGIRSMVLHPNGRLLAATTTSIDLPRTGAAIRTATVLRIVQFLPNGARDASAVLDIPDVRFGSQHRISDDPMMPAMSMIVGHGAKTLVALQAKRVAPTSLDRTSAHDIIVLRLAADGRSIDPTFGSSGFVEVPAPPGGSLNLAGLAEQPDGKLVLAGTTCASGVWSGCGPFLARLDANGAIDPSFSAILAPPPPPAFEYIRALALSPGGEIVLAGRARAPGAAPADSARAFLVKRYDSSGAPDAGFGTAGSAFVSSPTAHCDAWALDLQPDGKIVVGGRASRSFALVRLLPNGSIDSGFASGGVATTSFPLPINYNVSRPPPLGISHVEVLPDGRILALGPRAITQNGFDWDFALARYLPDGSPDPTFGGDGRVASSVGEPVLSRRSSYPTALLVLPTGRFLVSGFGAVALARYLP